MFAQERNRRLLVFLKRIISARQKHRDRAGGGHRPGARVVEIFEMVGGQGAILSGERGALAVGQLLGMKTDPKAMVGGRLEQPLDLVRSEGDSFAESVD